MKTIFTTTVNSITLRFTSKGLDLDPSHNLYDPTVQAVYTFGQALHPIIVSLRQYQGCPHPESVESYAAQFPDHQSDAALSILQQAADEFYDQAFNQIGYVYLIRNEGGLYKIGKSKQIERRIKRFDVKLPFEVEAVVLIETFDPAAEEKLWHTRFANKRVSGEWFALDDADVAWMKQSDLRYTQAPAEVDQTTPNPNSHAWQFGENRNG